MERQTGQQDSDPYSPITIDQILEMVNAQRGLVLYYSLAAGYLYSWLLAPGAGKVSVEAQEVRRWREAEGVAEGRHVGQMKENLISSGYPWCGILLGSCHRMRTHPAWQPERRGRRQQVCGQLPTSYE